jgi:Tol biopolymer transport system component
MKVGGGIEKLLDIPRSNPLGWNPDGTGITFIKTIDGVANIWTQAMDGGAPKQETKFTSDGITNFDWSQKGQLVCSRSSRSRDAFLIRNFR